MTHVRTTHVVVVLVVAQAVGFAAVGGAVAAAEAPEDAVGPTVAQYGDRVEQSVADAERVLSDGVQVLSYENAPGETVVLLAGYSRYDSSDPLQNDKRRLLYEAVKRLPGESLTGTARESGVSASTARHHVRVLEAEGLVDTEKIRGRKCLYSATFDGDTELAAALREDALAAVLTAVERERPATITALAATLERSPGTVSHHVGRLVEAGLLRYEPDGRTKQVSLTATARDGL